LLQGNLFGTVGPVDDVCDFENGPNKKQASTPGDRRQLRDESLPQANSDLSAVADTLAQQVVRVEANFLRLPLFTLDNKHMRTMDGLRCEGTFRRGGKSFAFTYVVTRNTATYYPGPLARSAHFALLSIATERGLPVRNPIVFTWRELCSRMDIQVSGKAVTSLQAALTATKGLMIESRAALFSKAENAPINTEDRTKIISLYDEVEFYGAVRNDGTPADQNAVWLSHWYLENLNALYSGPLDYVLWRSLNEKSLIASRLYEFLFLKFYSGQNLLRFNYPTLVKFIPVRTERYLSDARKQLEPAFALLTEAGVLANVQWIQSRGGLPQILLHRGSLLASADSNAETYDVGEEDFTLDRIEDLHLPEWQVVSAFHQAWGNDNFRPTKAELDLARQLLTDHGHATMQELLPRLVKRLKVKWPEAKNFCAISRYLPEVRRELEQEKHHAEREKQALLQQEEARRQAIRQAQDRAVLKALWDTLLPAEQEQIRAHVLKGQPASLQKHPGIIERLCLAELARRKGLGESQRAIDCQECRE
jgi:hypothetical protein